MGASICRSVTNDFKTKVIELKFTIPASDFALCFDDLQKQKNRSILKTAGAKYSKFCVLSLNFR